MPFGIADVDLRLAGDGLAAALHEAGGETPSPNDDAAATLFLAAASARFAISNGGSAQVLWALTRRDLFAPALAQAGLTPDRLLYAECRNDDEVLAVMEEGMRHGSLVVGRPLEDLSDQLEQSRGVRRGGRLVLVAEVAVHGEPVVEQCGQALRPALQRVVVVRRLAQAQVAKRRV